LRYGEFEAFQRLTFLKDCNPAPLTVSRLCLGTMLMGGATPANSYERCQASFGRILVDYMRMVLGVLAGFSDRTPYPSGKRSDGGAVREVCRGFDGWSLERFPFERIGLTVLLQLPNSYPCIRGQ
jgi:hypothetical protein